MRNMYKGSKDNNGTNNVSKGAEQLDACYQGLFYCHIREEFHRWPEHISFYKNKRI